MQNGLSINQYIKKWFHSPISGNLARGLALPPAFFFRIKFHQKLIESAFLLFNLSHSISLFFTHFTQGIQQSNVIQFSISSSIVINVETLQRKIDNKIIINLVWSQSTSCLWWHRSEFRADEQFLKINKKNKINKWTHCKYFKQHNQVAVETHRAHHRRCVMLLSINSSSTNKVIRNQFYVILVTKVLSFFCFFLLL